MILRPCSGIALCSELDLIGFVFLSPMGQNVCNSFEGVRKSYAIQAGTEVRIFVNPEDIDDLGAVKLSHNITRKIERDLQYPGQIKVNVVRETRAEEFAK